MLAVFVFGSGYNRVMAHIDDERPCTSCGRMDTRDAVIEYDYQHIFRIFRSMKNKVVRVVCAACGDSHEISEPQQRQLYSSIGRNPIPFMDRHGAHVLLLVLMAWGALAYFFPCAVNPSSARCIG
jgi:hypothetical protein